MEERCMLYQPCLCVSIDTLGCVHRPLSKAMAERCMKVVKRTGGGGVAFAPLAAEDPSAQADHNGTVLGLLAVGACVFVCTCVCVCVCSHLSILCLDDQRAGN